MDRTEEEDAGTELDFDMLGLIAKLKPIFGPEEELDLGAELDF